MNIVVMNVPVSAGVRAWRRCVHLAANRAGVFGFNEVFTRRQRAVMRAVAVRRGLEWAGMGSPNPVFWRWKEWTRLSSRVIELHGELPGRRRWGGYNAARYVTEVVLEHRRWDWHPHVVVLCWHGVPEGRKVDPAMRREARGVYRDVLGELIDAHTAAGRVVWLVGDTNIRGDEWEPAAGARFRWVAGERIDKIGVAVPGGWRLSHESSSEFEAPTDHGRGILARAGFERV